MASSITQHDLTFVQLQETELVHYISDYRDLFERCFNIERTEQELLDKLKVRCSEENTKVNLLLDSSNKVVAALSFFPRRFSNENGSQVLWEAADSMVRSDFQGCGLFNKIILLSLDEFEKQKPSLVYGFPNQNAYRGWLGAGADFVIPSSVFVSPISPATVIFSKLGLRSSNIYLIDKIWRGLRLRNRNIDHGYRYIVADEIDSFAERWMGFDHYSKKLKRKYCAQEIAKRYAGPNFKFLRIHSLGEDKALFILKKYSNGLVTVFEWSFRSPEDLCHCWSALVSAAAAGDLWDHITYLRVQIENPDDMEDAALIAASWRRVKRENHIMTIPFKATDEGIPECIIFNKGCSDEV